MMPTISGVHGRTSQVDSHRGESASPRAADGGPPGLPQPLQYIDGLGLEGIAAMLTIGAAQDQQKVNKQLSRAARDEAKAATDEQVAALKDKANNTAREAVANAVVGAVAGMLTAAGAAGKTAADIVKPICDGMSKAMWGAEAIRNDADATAWAGRAKNAESDRDEFLSNAKAAAGTIEKAQQAIQSFQQERLMIRRAILKSG